MSHINSQYYTDNMNILQQNLTTINAVKQANALERANILAFKQRSEQEANTTNLNKLNTDIMTKKREIQIYDNYAVQNENSIFNLKILLLFVVICIVVIILSMYGILPVNISNIVLILGGVVFIGVMIKLYLNNTNRNVYQWDNINWNYTVDKNIIT
jgi:hypothetical protein